jgi:hypothetical protein
MIGFVIEICVSISLDLVLLYFQLMSCHMSLPVQTFDLLGLVTFDSNLCFSVRF